ncbi:MAG: ATP-binding protein [Pirellula sp.]|jgi:PAS domain S-box-containing protein|nr:ATP-binding protein [Pirellula sp.]
MSNSGACSTIVEELREMLTQERSSRVKAESRAVEAESRALEIAEQLRQSHLQLRESSDALEHEVQRAKAVFDSAAEGIIIFDDSGRMESMNKAAEIIFGITIGTESFDVTLYSVQDLFVDFLRCESEAEDCLATRVRESMGHSVETDCRRVDGSTIPVELVMGQFSHGDRRWYSGIVRDLSRKRVLEAQLSQAQKLESVGQLAAGIAHELNTPIQFVGDNTRFLKDSFATIEKVFLELDGMIDAPEESQCSLSSMSQRLRELYQSSDLSFVREEIPRAIDQTLEGAENVARIVRAMKVFSHPGSKELQQIDLNSALESTITVSRNEWKYCAKVKTDFAIDLPKLHCLPAELNQAFLNILVNGAHAIQSKGSDEQGLLTVSTRSDGVNIYVDISDTGTGIPEGIRNRIFDPFFTTKGVGKGTGQGLAIAYNVVVEIHKGKLFFDTKEGGGATFHIELPLKHQTKPVHSLNDKTVNDVVNNTTNPLKTINGVSQTPIPGVLL